MIDRRALVDRHRPRLDAGSAAVLSVGNGRFAVGLDRTGTHTLPPVPGAAQATALAEWGWHGVPQRDDATWEEHRRVYDTPHGPARYMDLVGPSEAGPTRAARPGRLTRTASVASSAPSARRAGDPPRRTVRAWDH